MIRTAVYALAALGLLAGAPARADDAYTLKLYKSKKGDKTEHEMTETTKTKVHFVGAGMEKKDEIASGKKEAYTDEILEKAAGDKRATKLLRTYSVSEKTEKDETTKAKYVGQPVLIQKSGAKYEFSIKGQPLKEADAPDLFKKFNDKKDDEPQDQDLLPTDPVKVGGTWKIPADLSERMFKTLGGEDKMKYDAKKSSITGKLLKAYKKDGAQFGVMEVTITVFVTDIDLGGQMVKTSANSKFVLKATIDACIDATVPYEDGKIDLTMDIVSEIPTVGTLTLNVKTTGTEKTRAAKP